MPIVLLNPWGALLALLLVLPVVAFVRLRERDRAVRATLKLAPARRRALFAPVVAALLAGALLTVAATQPALVRSSSQPRRFSSSCGEETAGSSSVCTSRVEARD